MRTIKLESLNSECLMAVNRCARYLKQTHGVTLKLQDKDVLMNLSKAVRSVDDEHMKELYLDLKKKMVECVNNARRAEFEKTKK